MTPRRPRFGLADAPPEVRENPIVRFTAEMDPGTEALLEECAKLDRELGMPDLPDVDDE